MIVVTLSRRCSARISPRRRSRTLASSADSGSSSSSSDGDVASARASAIRCCWPPDSCPGYLPPASGSPTSVEQLLHARDDLGASAPPVHEAVRDVVGDREVGKQRVRLEHDPVVARGRRRVGHVAAVLDHAAAGLPFEARDDAQQRRLAAAGRTDEAHHLARRDREVDRLQRDEAAERLVYGSRCSAHRRRDQGTRVIRSGGALTRTRR